MKRPVPMIRTDTQYSQVQPVPDRSRTGGPDPLRRPVRVLPSLWGGQVGQGGAERLRAERLTVDRSGRGPRGLALASRRHELRAVPLTPWAVRFTCDVAQNARSERCHLLVQQGVRLGGGHASVAPNRHRTRVDLRIRGNHRTNDQKVK
jgi:hypothetical protein